MSSLSAPAVPLQIEWQPINLELDASGQGQLIKKPRTALQSYIPGCEPSWQDTDEVTLQQFFIELQKYLQHALQEKVAQASYAISMVQEEHDAKLALMREAMEFMNSNVQQVQAELRRYAERDDLNADMMEIEWSNPVAPPNFLEEVQKAISDGRLVIARPSTPHPPPPSRSHSRAATRTMKPRVNPFAAFPIQSRKRTVPIVMPMVGASPLPPGRSAAPFNFGGPSRQFGDDEDLLGSPLRQSSVPPGPWSPPPIAPLAPVQGGSGGNPPPPPVAGGAPPPGDNSDSSDSEPEGNDRRGWRRYLKKKLEKQQRELLSLMTQHLQPPAPSHPPSASRAREPKAPPPTKFQGKAEQVETFLRQCENVFSIESLSFTSEEVKIRYAGNLMEGEAPTRWYEAYHNSIDQVSANRIAGMPVKLDERWRRWDSFVDAFRAAFGEAISRDDAVTQWNSLTHTARGGIDAFLNSIIQLMWKTGYQGQLVDDKIQNSLLPELGLSWALFGPKPKSLMERIAALRELGHTHERYQVAAVEKNPPTRTKKTPQAREIRQPRSRREPAGPSEPKKAAENKDRAVELKGIPGEILEERRKAEVCLKCGKSRHKWTDCWSKEPTVVRVASVKVQKRKRGSGRGGPEKKAKVAAVVAEEPLNVLPEVTEDFVFEPIPDSDNEIIWDVSV